MYFTILSAALDFRPTGFMNMHKKRHGRNSWSITLNRQPANTVKPSLWKCLAKASPNPVSQPVMSSAFSSTYKGNMMQYYFHKATALLCNRSWMCQQFTGLLWSKPKTSTELDFLKFVAKAVLFKLIGWLNNK